MAAVCIYDNHIYPDVFIRNIVGEKTFGEIILKRVSVKQRFMQYYENLPVKGQLLEYDHEWEFDTLKKAVRSLSKDTRIIQLFSSQIIRDEGKEGVRVLFEKAGYSESNYVIRNEEGNIAGFIMSNTGDYLEFMELASNHLTDEEVYRRYRFDFSDMSADGFFDISVYSNFRNYITGGFDARFFNSFAGDEYVVKKISENREKIKAEYTFYGLLPDNMKPWFVMPYDYGEDEKSAFYSMKRYHMTDLAVRFVHGAIDLKEFDKLMEMVFYFLNSRAAKEIPAKEYKKTAESLYITKVKTRIEALKKHPGYEDLKRLSGSGDKEYIDLLLNKYLTSYERLVSKAELKNISVIGHGDLCFSNMLFDKNTELLMLIDPKGALKEEDLWTDPYYDVAKLSHSVCGRYDLFNNGLYRFDLDDDLKPELEIEFDNSEYVKIFKEYLKKNGFSYELVRLYEASLFLSMLPLHMDYPKKVFGFMKNAEAILEELK